VFRLGLFFLFIILFPAVAFAGDAELQPVYDRVPKGFEVPGIRLGDIMLHPSAELVEIFNDNIYATKSDHKSDFVTNIAPNLNFQSLNTQQGFQADLGVDSGIYRQFSREDYNDVHADLKPYMQVTKASKLDGELSFQHLHEPRTSEAASNNIGAEEPVQYSQSLGRLGWEYKPGRIGIDSFIQHEMLRFDNVPVMGGGPDLVNKDRDRDEESVGVELSCDLTDRNKIYTALKGFDHNYQHRDYDPVTGGYTGVTRDSTGADMRAGYLFDATKLIKLDINGGYYNQDFTDHSLQNVNAMVGKAIATWLLTPLTTVDFSAKRDVFETIQPDASAFAQSDFGFKVTHELRRNVLLGLEGNAGVNNYIGSTRKDTYWGAGPKITYKMNRNIDLHAEYIFDRRNSNLPDLDYDRQRVFAGIEVKF
jgi:hypothetical protein